MIARGGIEWDNVPRARDVEPPSWTLPILSGSRADIWMPCLPIDDRLTQLHGSAALLCRNLEALTSVPLRPQLTGKGIHWACVCLTAQLRTAIRAFEEALALSAHDNAVPAQRVQR